MPPKPSHPTAPEDKKVILCFDMDGTLLDENERVHPLDKPLLLNPPPEALFMLATGRSLTSVLLTFVKNGVVRSGESMPFPVVCQNGGVTYLPGGVLLGCRAFEKPTLAALLERLERAGEITILLFLTRQIHSYRLTPYGAERLEQYDLPTTPLPPGYADLPVTKVMCLSDDPDPLARLNEACAGLPLERSYSFGTILEFNPPGIHKAAGITALLDAMSLRHLPLFAAGDGMNDLSMLRMATRAFAPQGGSHVARDAADVVVAVESAGILTSMLAEWRRWQ